MNMKRGTFLKGLLALQILPTLAFKSDNKVRKNAVVEFTPEMLEKYNFGLYIINDKADVFKNPNYAATVSWKLGYHLDKIEQTGSVKDKRLKLRHSRYFMVNFLTDGWASPIGNDYKEVCDYLNSNPYGERFRIMTVDEVIYLIRNKSNQEQLVRFL